VDAVACASAGNCTAAGWYSTGAPDACGSDCAGPFVVNEQHGSWEKVTAHPANWRGYPASIACPAAGDCTMAWSYTNPENETITTGELLSETDGNWAASHRIAGTQSATSVSCARPGYCAAGGSTVAGNAFVITQWHGIWGKAATLTGLPRRAAATVSAVACPPKVTLCIAGGHETPVNSDRTQAFVVSQAG
jgi:hypothetical protein